MARLDRTNGKILITPADYASILKTAEKWQKKAEENYKRFSIVCKLCNIDLDIIADDDADYPARADLVQLTLENDKGEEVTELVEACTLTICIYTYCRYDADEIIKAALPNDYTPEELDGIEDFIKEAIGIDPQKDIVSVINRIIGEETYTLIDGYKLYIDNSIEAQIEDFRRIIDGY